MTTSLVNYAAHDGVSIDKVYVINLESRPDRLDEIKRRFAGTILESKLERWDATNGRDMDAKTIADITVPFCNDYCSYGMIGCWLSHYRIWQDVVENGYENVIVLEDDSTFSQKVGQKQFKDEGRGDVSVSTKQFDDRLSQILGLKGDGCGRVPRNYDLLYLGCIGSCTVGGNVAASAFGYGNKDVVQVGDEDDCDVKEEYLVPGFPLMTHAYMLSGKGAKKLVKSPMFKKIAYHIDFTLALFYNSTPNSDFKVYALKNELISQDDGGVSDIASSDHPFIESILNRFGGPGGWGSFGGQDLAKKLNVQIANVRAIKYPITFYSLTFAILAFIVGATQDTAGIVAFFVGMVLIALVDVLKYRKTESMKDLVLCVIFFMVGRSF